MSGLLGTNSSIASDLNLMLQIVVFIMLLIGVKFVKEKTPRGLKRHRRFMTYAVALNVISILLVMGPSFVANFSAVLAEPSTISFPLTLIHHSLGIVAEILGIIFVFKKFGNVRMWMRLTMSTWVISFILGMVFYFEYYMI